MDDLVKGQQQRVGFLSFNDFVTQVYTAETPAEKSALVDSFMTWAQATTGIPYVEDSTRAFFLYRSSSVSNVAVAGDFNGWDPANHDFTQLSGTNLYYRMETFEPTARLDYKFVLDGGQWILDPLNPNTCAGGFGPNSELAMSHYIQPPEIQSYEIPHGSVSQDNFTDSNGATHDIRMYLPPGYTASGDSFPVAFFHDGGEWLDLAYAQNTLDYLIHYQEIQPIIGVFVDPNDRNQDYSYSYAYLDMFCNELVPWIEERYRVKEGPAHRATIGVSLGGLTSLLFSIQRPDVFGNCGAFSPAIWFGDIVNQYASAIEIQTKIYLDSGTYEPAIYQATQSLVELLDDRNVAYVNKIWYEGHSWGAWRAHLDEALTLFWPVEMTGIAPE
ncbi:MAG: hypothetical protein K9N36_06890 [Candidatus Marinimicrobia bacterium]|nr:hypothetical protein [Candidatus Neomarinimicrobiota bacterium]